MTEVESDVPQYPYVKFGCIRKEYKDRKKTEIPEVYYLNVRGCHGTLANLSEIEKRGHKILGCGNLNLASTKYKAIKEYVEIRTGANVDPRVMALASASAVMDAKVEEKRRDLKR